jgi:iron complex transport system ATP-binding protein
MSDSIVGREVVIERGDKVVVKKSNFEIPLRKITAIIGPNGSGKSTILHAIAGLLEVKSGEIALPETSKISYVMQYTAIPVGAPLSVREAVTMGRWKTLKLWQKPSKQDREIVTNALKRLDIEDLADRHLSELSGGQRQRVYVAQGIAQDHNLLFLDEPLTGLDLNSAGVIDDLIHDEPAQGHTVVLTTHDLAEAKAADYVILMAGKVIAHGHPSTVLTVENLNVAYGLTGLHHDHSNEGFPDLDPHHG